MPQSFVPHRTLDIGKLALQICYYVAFGQFPAQTMPQSKNSQFSVGFGVSNLHADLKTFHAFHCDTVPITAHIKFIRTTIAYSRY